MPGDFFGLSGHVIEGQFHVMEVAGEGGFSVVYRGQHLTLREPVAIKCLKYQHRDPAVIASFTQRFFDESRIMYRLSQGNLNIVRAITTGVTVAPSTGVSVPYMVLEWLEGTSLSKMMKERRAKKAPGMSLTEAISLFDPAAIAIAYAHSQGVVHRDIKPGNLFLQDVKNAPPRMKVLDFGMAKVLTPEAMGGLESAQTLGGVMVLSPQYVTPEQLDKAFGSVGPWTDVYSFALILVEALTAKRARDAESFADLMMQITQDDAPTPLRRGANVSHAVERVFERALARAPKDRFLDLGSFWGELKAASLTLEDAEVEPELKTMVDAPINLGSTLVMPPARPSQPRTSSPSPDFKSTMPMQQMSAAPTPTPHPAPAQAHAPTPTPPLALALALAPTPAPLAIPRTESSVAIAPKPRAKSRWKPKSKPKAKKPSAGFVAFLLLFIALSLGVSGLLLVQLYVRT